jgi:subtilisin family serine protease
VIVDDVAYLDEPFFQDGSALDTAVEQVVAEGVSYFTAASNEGTDFFQSAFAPIETTLPGLPGRWAVANFGTSGQPAPYLTLTVPKGGSFAIDLQWDQPFATIGSGHGAANSLALALYTVGNQLIGTAGTLGLGQNPEQLLQFTNTTGQTGLKLVVVSNSFARPSLFKLIAYGNATIVNADAGQGSGTVAGHEMVQDANTVGAMAYSATPAFGGNDTIEGFSSVGPGEELFDSQGNRLATPVDTGKVSFDAPDGSMTSVFEPFYGTSAAAPNAAAVAALMQQANPDLTPGQITTMLDDSAIAAHGAAGGVGAGLIQAPDAVSLALAALHA